MDYHPTLKFPSCLQSVFASLSFGLVCLGFTALIWFTSVSKPQQAAVVNIKAQINPPDATCSAPNIGSTKLMTS